MLSEEVQRDQSQSMSTVHSSIHSFDLTRTHTHAGRERGVSMYKGYKLQRKSFTVILDDD